MKKYVEKITGKENLVNEWFATCREKAIPYITLENRNKYASVRWDYITFSSDIDTKIDENQDKYVSEIMDIFRKYANPKSTYNVSGGLIEFDFIDIDYAHDCANEIYDVAVKICSV